MRGSSEWLLPARANCCKTWLLAIRRRSGHRSTPARARTARSPTAAQKGATRMACTGSSAASTDGSTDSMSGSGSAAMESVMAGLLSRVMLAEQLAAAFRFAPPLSDR